MTNGLASAISSRTQACAYSHCSMVRAVSRGRSKLRQCAAGIPTVMREMWVPLQEFCTVLMPCRHTTARRSTTASCSPGYQAHSISSISRLSRKGLRKLATCSRVRLCRHPSLKPCNAAMESGQSGSISFCQARRTVCASRIQPGSRRATGAAPLSSSSSGSSRKRAGSSSSSLSTAGTILTTNDTALSFLRLPGPARRCVSSSCSSDGRDRTVGVEG